MLGYLSFALLLRDVIAALFFVIAGILDWRKREIDPKVWIPPLVVGVVVNVWRVAQLGVSELDKLSLLVGLVFVAIVAILTFGVKAIGGADLLAVLSLVVLYPFPPLYAVAPLHCISALPPIVEIFVYYSMTMLGLFIYNLIINLSRLKTLESLELPLSKKLFYLATARIMKVNEYLKTKFYFPVYVPGIVERKSFDVYEDDIEWRKKLQGLDGDTPLIASWGIPTVTFIAVSLLIYLLLRSSPLALVLHLAICRW